MPKIPGDPLECFALFKKVSLIFDFSMLFCQFYGFKFTISSSKTLQLRSHLTEALYEET